MYLFSYIENIYNIIYISPFKILKLIIFLI